MFSASNVRNITTSTILRFCALHDLHVPIPIQLPQRNSTSAAHVCPADALFLCGSWASCTCLPLARLAHHILSYFATPYSSGACFVVLAHSFCPSPFYRASSKLSSFDRPSDVFSMCYFLFLLFYLLNFCLFCVVTAFTAFCWLQIRLVRQKVDLAVFDFERSLIRSHRIVLSRFTDGDVYYKL